MAFKQNPLNYRIFAYSRGRSRISGQRMRPANIQSGILSLLIDYTTPIPHSSAWAHSIRADHFRGYSAGNSINYKQLSALGRSVAWPGLALFLACRAKLLVWRASTTIINHIIIMMIILVPRSALWLLDWLPLSLSTSLQLGLPGLRGTCSGWEGKVGLDRGQVTSTYSSYPCLMFS